MRSVQPSLSLYVVEREENLHLLAFRLYRAYHRYYDLLRLNPQIQNPNSMPVGQELLIYTDKGRSL